jgi:AcrR family transcriptional regulator
MTDQTEIVAAARRLLEADGPEALTMRAIATELGIKAPSLYKHIRDKAELEAALITDGFTEQAAAFEKALKNSGNPAQQFGTTYRNWALQHPHLYHLMTGRSLPRDLLPIGLEDRAAAPVVAAARGDHDRARAAWAFAHGMVVLELADRFPPGADLEPAWQLGLRQLLPETELPGEP